MEALSFEDFMGLSLKAFNRFGWKSANKSIWRPIWFWSSMFILILYIIFVSTFKDENSVNESTFLSVGHDVASVALQASFFFKTFSILFLNHSKIQMCFEKLRNLFPKTVEEQKKYKVLAARKIVTFKNTLITVFYVWNTTLSALIHTLGHNITSLFVRRWNL